MVFLYERTGSAITLSLLIFFSVKVYSLNENGVEQIIQFASNKWFIILDESVISNSSNKFIIKTLEDSESYEIDFHKVKSLMAKNEVFMDFIIQIFAFQFFLIQERLLLFMNSLDIQRFNYFIKMYPSLANRLKFNDIASYLGISIENLSKIRKKLIIYF